MSIKDTQSPITNYQVPVSTSITTATTDILTDVLYCLGLILLLGGSFALQTHYLMWGEWSFDQGHNLLLAKLMSAGYRPYTEIFMDRPPLFFWSIGPSYSFYGSIEGVQLMMVAYAILAIAAIASLGQSLAGRWTGLLAGALFAFNFTFFFSTRKVDPEIPAMSLGLVGLALALRYHRSGHVGWLAASGIAMGGSLLTHYFVPWFIPLILLILAVTPRNGLTFNVWNTLTQRPNWVIRNWLIWSVAVVVVALGSWFVYDVYRVFEQAILFHLLKTGESGTTLAQNIDRIWGFFAKQPILSLTAALGLVLTIVRFRRGGWVAVIWAGLTLGFLLFYSPLRSKHLIVLTPLVGLLAALAVSVSVEYWRNRQKNRWAGLVGTVALLVLLGGELLLPYRTSALSQRDMVDEAMQPLTDLLDRFTSPADCLITDHPYLAFTTDRLPPPWLANLSYARFDSGLLDKQTMVDITENHGCQVMAPILDRIKNANRSYYDWAKSIYMRTWVLDGREIMLGKPLLEVQPQLPLDANFSGQVKLLGADWYPAQHSGHLSLYWHTLQPFTEDFKIFVQLRNQDGQTVASADHEAFGGLLPTRLWYANRILKVTNRLEWPADLPPGHYKLYVGMYHPATGQRLPIIADTSGENAAIISLSITNE